jgi:diguanylate cyclase (GGDEF)-like protein
MKRSFAVRLLFILMALPAVCAATPLTTLHALRALSNEDVALNPFVSFEATVVYFDNAIHDLNLQDGRDGIFVHFSDDLNLMPGDRVRVEGRLMPSFLPYLASSRVQVLHHGSLPAALTVSFGDLVRTQFVSIRVKVRGRIRAADLVDSSAVPAGRLQMAMEGGYVDLELETRDLAAMRALLDTEVEVEGVAGRKFDSKMQQTGVRLRVLSLHDIHVLHPAPADPWSLPASPLGSIFTGYHVVDKSSRLHVRGVLTYYEPTIGAVLQSGRQSLWIDTAGIDKLEIGDQTDAIGFPVADEGRLMLIQAQLRPTGVRIPVAPLKAQWSQLAGWTRNAPTGHGFDLVSMDARIVSQVRTDHEDRYVLDAGGSVFSAIFRHRAPPAPIPALHQLALGSQVRVTGICWIAVGTPQNGQVPFDILLRSPDDVVVLHGPPLWSVRNLAIALGVGFLFFLVLGARTLLFERRARQQSAATARIERRRRRILEGINAMRPLADVVEEITGVVSLQLRNAPCWCNITGGATLGPHPSSTAKLHVVDYAIPARAGGLLGSLHVGLPTAAKPPDDLEDALSMGAGLVAVAIESRRLYTDLIHRSEFDQLTGLYNRAALDQKMEAQIEIARERGNIFALIYIDFDDFKQVNDTYGHRTGDLFLEEAALRMKAQLRPCDQLARLGGDEFAALVTNIRSRDEVEEVALRLQRCLAEPFCFGNLRLPGSASTGIALYPADANSEDGLLTHADTAMYASKAERKRWREAS